MQRNEIALFEQFLERDKFHAEFFRVGIGENIVTQHAHSEARRAPHHRLTDAPAADDAEGFAKNIVAPRGRPLARDHAQVPRVNAPRDAEQQRPRVIGDGLVEHARRVGDDDAEARRGGDVDRVVAHAPARDDLEARGLGRSEDGGVVAVGADERGVDAGEQFLNRVGGQRPELLGNDDLAAGFAENFQRARADFGDGPGGDQNFPTHKKIRGC